MQVLLKEKNDAGDKIMGFEGGFICGSHAQYFTLPGSKKIKVMVLMPQNITRDKTAACLEGVFYGTPKQLFKMHSAFKRPGFINHRLILLVPTKLVMHNGSFFFF
jgi:hypothetical protein